MTPDQTITLYILKLKMLSQIESNLATHKQSLRHSLLTCLHVNLIREEEMEVDYLLVKLRKVCRRFTMIIQPHTLKTLNLIH